MIKTVQNCAVPTLLVLTATSLVPAALSSFVAHMCALLSLVFVGLTCVVELWTCGIWSNAS